MVIKPEGLTYLQESHELKVEYVFFEKADQPSTRTRKGVTEGILMLTDNQLGVNENDKKSQNNEKR